MSRKADEVGSKEHETLLEINGGFGADFDLVQVEDLLALFDPGLDGLAAIVLGKPSREVLHDRVISIVEQAAVLERSTGLKPFQSHVQR